jgi:chromate transporter
LAEPAHRPGAAALAATPADPGVRELFAGFSSVGLSGFGGVLPFARRMLVERRAWVSSAEFNTLLGLCQFLPGPNVVNLAVCVGARFRGARGALAAVTGLLAGPMLIVLGLGVLYEHYGELTAVRGALRGVAAAGAGLLLATAWRMATAVRHGLLLLPLAAAIFALIAAWRWPLLQAMAAVLPAALAIGWLCARRDAGGDGRV